MEAASSSGMVCPWPVSPASAASLSLFLHCALDCADNAICLFPLTDVQDTAIGGQALL